MNLKPLIDYWNKWITVRSAIDDDGSLQSDGFLAIEKTLKSLGYETRYKIEEES